MKRVVKKYAISHAESFKQHLLLWSRKYDDVAWLDSNSYQQTHSSFQAILAIDALTAIRTDYYHAFEKLQEYIDITKDWIFGYLTYDLKNDTEQLSSLNHDGLAFPDLYFFQPKKLFFVSDDAVELHYLSGVADEMDFDWTAINALSESYDFDITKPAVKISLRTSKDNYFEKVNKMLAHIERGDIYEANFCQEFYSENVELDPEHTFFHLNELSRPPFATFFKNDSLYAMCASPERYLRKQGSKVISQPIKGTAPRNSNPAKDTEIINQLVNDPKERSENIMITDLVRNDLSRFAVKGSVTVEELCQVYSFEQVHQMISTIRCEVPPDISITKMLKETFPMGSMTGAPKISAMQIIEELEDSKRGLYSGAIGYITADGDFDFNVVIRSILYNKPKQYVSFSVGGAITAKSVPEHEYEECLLKAKAMREVLEA